MWRFLILAAMVLCCLSCSREEGGKRGGGSAGEVVLYSSVDDYLLREVVAAFEQESGLRVRIAGDTEATKTTGLVERLLAEKERPRADVWWSSEPFGTVRLWREGILDESAAGGGAPRPFHEFAARARVLVYRPDRVPTPPADLGGLIDFKYEGRIGIARPQFGTTRGHVGLLLMDCGEEAYRQWVRSLKTLGVRVYDGNATVVRAVAQGEIDIGLTDTDDVWSGQRNDWPVELSYAGNLCPPRTGEQDGALLIPNTVALVRGRPNPEAAQKLLQFLLSERVERMMAESDSRNIPTRPALAEEFRELAVPGPRTPDFVAVANTIPRALEIWEEEMGK